MYLPSQGSMTEKANALCRGTTRRRQLHYCSYSITFRKHQKSYFYGDSSDCSLLCYDPKVNPV